MCSICAHKPQSTYSCNLQIHHPSYFDGVGFVSWTMLWIALLVTGMSGGLVTRRASVILACESAGEFRLQDP